MLRLEKLELVGFKSFFSRTEFHFEKDITAVVGPNGCGKSNIGDALNWVIGEQSVKSLRGDRMEDVIFSGSEGRRPLGMAEVSLHLRNGEGGETDQVVITRRLFRSGESEYLLNGGKTRLRDIQETLARVNVGSGVYSIIEQGKVDAALSSRPRERRILIEEAAGIAIYKARKRQAEIKLEATEANLLRVNDIVVELEKQIGSLKRQAARARRYARTMEDVTRHERILLYHDHLRLEGERAAAQGREDEARAAESEAAGRLATLEALDAEERRRLEDRDAEWRRRREDLHALDREMDRHEREIALAREQAREAEEGAASSRDQAAALAARLEETSRLIEQRRTAREELERHVGAEDAEKERLEEARRSLEERIEAQEGELAGARTAFLQAVDALSEARNRRRQAGEELDRLRRRADLLGREMSEAAADLAERSRSTEAARQALADAERVVEATRDDLLARRSDLERLEAGLAREAARRDEARHRLHGHEERLKALEEIEAASISARDLLTGAAPLRGILSEELSVPARLEAAVESYLGDRLEAAIVDGPEEALAGIVSLKRDGRGRAAFLPADSASEAPVIALPDEVKGDPGFVGRLGDLLDLTGTRLTALAPALVRAVVVEDVQAAARMRSRAPWFDYITLEGDLYHTNGLIEGGAKRPEAVGVLRRRRARGDLTASIETGRAHLAKMDQLVAGLTHDRSAAGSTVATCAESLSAAEKDLIAQRHRLEAVAEEEARARARVATLEGEQTLAGEESNALSSEEGRLSGMLEDLEAARRAREASIQTGQEEIAAMRAAVGRVSESFTVVRASLSASRQRLEAMDADLNRLMEADQELRDRVEAETARATDLDARRAAAGQREQAGSAALVELSARREGIEKAVREGETALGELRSESDRRSQELRTARTALEQDRARREELSLERERAAADLRHLVSGALSGGAAPLEQIFASMTEEEKGMDLDQVRASLAELKEKRDRMGPVNMMALDQFRELEERYAFLTGQRKDLLDAIASLKETIARINRTSRERFMDAFEKIRLGFNEIFRSLFGGGKADLKLMTGDGEEDILDCGLDISAQPPGKRLQSVTLLSGGEKALTALALLFSIFRYRPSPFCLLDEVDAPLDEANVIRFNDLLRSMSRSTQFVLITHNRRSMDAADMLYGVTMEEPGVSRTVSVVFDGERSRDEVIRTLPAALAARHKGSGRRTVISGAASGGGNGSSTRGPEPPSAS